MVVMLAGVPTLLAVWARYVDGKRDALDAFPVGSCHNAPDC